MMNFGVYDHSIRVRCSEFKHRNMFFSNSYFKPIDQPTIPIKVFQFVELDSILKLDFDRSRMIGK